MVLVVVFMLGLRGGCLAYFIVVWNVKLFSHLANIGDTRSLIIHPGVDDAPAAFERAEDPGRRGRVPDAGRLRSASRTEGTDHRRF